jgi:hypothetical protein
MTAIAINDASLLADHAIETLADRLGSPKAARLAVRNARVSDRALSVLLSRQPFERSEEDALAGYIARLWLQDPARFERLCGLVRYGWIIRQTVDSKNFRDLSRLFPAKDLSLACRLNAELGLHPGNPVDSERLQELVEKAGNACIRAWFRQASQAVRGEVAMTVHASRLEYPARDNGSEDSSGSEIAKAVATAINQEPRRL